ncbi:MAG: hypothetical protein JWO61_2 [Candidatus Saccharibacteria bacterium]|nr:hypothetical protein [Candidatus Saccharibacteria bacterium]
MVDALASGASVLRDVEVRVFSRVPKKYLKDYLQILLFMTNKRGRATPTTASCRQSLLSHMPVLLLDACVEAVPSCQHPDSLRTAAVVDERRPRLHEVAELLVGVQLVHDLLAESHVEVWHDIVGRQAAAGWAGDDAHHHLLHHVQV